MADDNQIRAILSALESRSSTAGIWSRHFPGRGDYMEFKEVQVECHSGYQANEYPVSFMFQGRRREIEEILDRWYEGGIDARKQVMRYFKVRTSGGEVFLLRYLCLFDTWSVRV